MRPYILHPLEVGVIVARMTEDEEVISAAILHDTIEDCEGVTAKMIEQMVFQPGGRTCAERK